MIFTMWYNLPVFESLLIELQAKTKNCQKTSSCQDVSVEVQTIAHTVIYLNYVVNKQTSDPTNVNRHKRARQAQGKTYFFYFFTVNVMIVRHRESKAKHERYIGDSKRYVLVQYITRCRHSMNYFILAEQLIKQTNCTLTESHLEVQSGYPSTPSHKTYQKVCYTITM